MKINKLLVPLFFFVATGCANHPATPPPKMHVTKIAFLPISEPDRVSVQNASGASLLVPIAGLALHADSKNKENTLSDKMAIQNTLLGKTLSSYIEEDLKKGGYEVSVLDNVPRPKDDPDDIEYQDIKTDADVVLHIYFDEIGMISEAFSAGYHPRTYIKVELYHIKHDEDVYDETLCFGLDARPLRSCTMISGLDVSYPTFEAMTSKTTEISQMWNSGTREISNQMVSKIVAAIKKRESI